MVPIGCELDRLFLEKGYRMKNTHQNVGIVGLGNMGKAIASSLESQGKKVFFFDPFQKGIPQFIEVDSILRLQEEVEEVILAVKPNLIQESLEKFTKPRFFVSIAAGISYATLSSFAPSGSTLVRMMPNLPLLVGRGAIAYYATSDVSLRIDSLFGSLGKCFALEKEDLMDTVTGLSGSGPAYVLTFLQALAEGGLKMGLPYETSLQLALETIEGTMVYFRTLREKDPGLHPMEVRNWVTSPGGTTIHGLDALEKAGFWTASRSAVEAATNRSKELGKG